MAGFQGKDTGGDKLTYVVVIPTRETVRTALLKSVRNQTLPPALILVADKKFSLEMPLGERIGKAINLELSKVGLEKFDYLVRFDDDLTPLPSDFMEQNLKLDADLIGDRFGHAQIIKVKPFLKYLGGKWPEVQAEDSYIIMTFRVHGLKISPHRIEAERSYRKHDRRYYLENGKARYRFGNRFLRLFLSFRDKIGGEYVFFNFVYVIAGYLLALLSRTEKHWFAEHARKAQSRLIFIGSN